MTNRIAGPGVGLPFPQALYPALISGIPYTAGTNRIGIAAGDVFEIPAGDFMLSTGKYSFLQILDPVTGLWIGYQAARGQIFSLHSDGTNYRVANLTGCPIAAVVTAGGSNYVQASTTITATPGNSVWQPVVGGQLASISITAGGSGYGLPPIISIPAPPNPGVPAVAVSVINAGGTVTTISLTNVGAGYTVAPAVSVIPNPFDPNINSLTAATAAVTSLTGTGAVTAALCLNPGAATTSAVTLTVTGVGSSATLTAQRLLSITSVTVGGGGAGYGATAMFTTYGGFSTATPAYNDGLVELTGFVPRQAMGSVTLSTGTVTTVTLVDGGLFLNAPGGLIQSLSGPTTVATLTLATGGVLDDVFITPM